MNHKFTKIMFILLIYMTFSISVFAENQSPVLRIGWFTTDGGQFIDKNGNRNGYCYEYYQEVAKYTGWKYQYIPGSWQECIERLENGEIDVLAFVQYTPERAKIFDFTTQNIGKSYSLLTSFSDNTTFTRKNLANYPNLHIGTSKGVTQIEQLQLFATENNIHYMEKRYDTLDGLLDGFKNREFDLMLHHSARKLEENEKVIVKFAPQPFYFAVKKGNVALRKQLDAALTEIEINNPYFSQRLMDKYYASNSGKSFVLTTQEKQFLKAMPPLRVVIDPSMQPLSYVENNEFNGITAKILDKITALLGINYELIPTTSYEQSLDLIRTGQADIICPYFTDYSWAEQNNVFTSSPFAQLQYSMISRRETLPQTITIAAVKNYKFNDAYLLANYSADQIIYYDTLDECIEAVKTGKQSVTFMPNYNAENYLRDYSYSNLTASTIPYTHYISFATSANRELATILDKALNSLSAAEIKTIIASHTIFQPHPVDLKAFVYRNPIESLIVLSLIGMIFFILFMVIIRTKNKHTAEIQHMLFTDEITNYQNYRQFKLTGETLLAADTTDKYALFYTDIQNFKYVNDTLGHSQGDSILCTVTHEISRFLTKDELCARVYADHFVLLIKYREMTDLVKRQQDFTAVIDALTTTAFTGYNIIYKIGIYPIPPDEYDIEKAVDLATYAKDTIGYVYETTCVHYNAAMRIQLQQEKDLESSMNPGLENREFEAYFQPRVDVYTKAIVGAEALVRWNHPRKGFLSPVHFIPFFEKNGFVTKIDLYMFEEVCRHLRLMRDQGMSLIPISSNFSRHHLNNPNLPEQLLAIANRYDVPTNMLEIEITETVATYNFELAVDMAVKLKEYGFLIAIDDFGSGYSSVQLLYKLPLNILKIDKDYTQNSSHNQIESSIISSLVDIVQHNGVEVIFEGVENQDQETLVKKHNCKLSQGYLYAKPLCFEQFERMLLQNASRTKKS